MKYKLSTKGVLWTDAGRAQEREMDEIERFVRERIPDGVVLDSEHVGRLRGQLHDIEDEISDLQDQVDELEERISVASGRADARIYEGIELLIAAGRDHDGELADVFSRRQKEQRAS